MGENPLKSGLVSGDVGGLKDFLQHLQVGLPMLPDLLTGFHHPIVDLSTVITCIPGLDKSYLYVLLAPLLVLQFFEQ